MLDVGFSEILLTSAIALIVLGPERLPKVARQVGNWMGRARAMARQLSEQLEREVSAEELLKEHPKPASGSAPSIAPPTGSIPGAVAPGAAPPAAAPPVEVDPAETVYGRDASFTTPAAMHGAAGRPADSKPPHE
jgi:Tat protein translocase TatB subunit